LKLFSGKANYGGAYKLLKSAKKKNPHKRAGEKKQIENAANHFLNLI